jgi:uncharacterized phage-associated protein
MFFKLDPNKAVEAAAVLLRLASNQTMTRKRLLALLYLADRLALQRTGRPILGGKLSALKWGPIHSKVYDLIKGCDADRELWSNHFQNESYHVILAHDPGIAELSRYEINLLNEVSERYMAMDTFDVADTTHFDEWKHAYVENTSRDIPPEDYLECAGLSARKEEILQDAAEKNFMDELLSCKQ